MLALSHDDLLTPGERFALELLIDLSAVLRCEGERDVVRLRAVGEPRDASAADLRARNWSFTASDGEVLVDRALLRLVLDVAGAEVEQRSIAADRFGRVPAGEPPWRPRPPRGRIQASPHANPGASPCASSPA